MRHPRHSKHRSTLGFDHLARMAQGACAAVPAEPRNRAISDAKQWGVSAPGGCPQPARAVLSIEYLGCLITVRGEWAAADKFVRGTYETCPISKEAVAAFKNLGTAEIFGDLIEAADLEFILEWAKSEIDFLLEQPF